MSSSSTLLTVLILVTTLLLQATIVHSSSSITLDSIASDNPSSVSDWSSINEFTSADSLTPLQSAAKYNDYIAIRREVVDETFFCLL